jgi:hypothetical protein
MHTELKADSIARSGLDAMEELKLLSAIIARYESFEFQLRGWLLLILGALIAALFAEKGHISGTLFGIIASLAVVIFLWMELIMRLTKRKAIWRFGVVEAALRDGSSYDGPAITRHLSKPPKGSSESYQMMRQEIKISLVWGFYLGLFIIILTLAITARYRL